jgi:transposase InsO family protein
MILKYSESYTKQSILDVCGMTRQGFKKSVLPKPSMERQVCEIVKEARKVGRRMGARAIFHTYGVDFIGINKFEQIVAKEGLNVPALKRRYVKTTQAVYEQEDKNLINGLVLNTPRQVIAGDITYVLLTNITYYIFTLKDAYSGLILALYATDNMKAEEALKALKEALKEDTLENFVNTIHHTDAGSQYKSNAYKNKLMKCGMKMSVAENCLENGMAEQLNGLVKNDYLTITHQTTLTQLRKQLKDIKHFLNNVRKVKLLGYKTPREFESEQIQLPKNQRVTKKLYDFTNAK